MNRSPLFLGLKSALPIVVGYIPVSMAFGSIARTQGLSVKEATLMALAIYSAPGQFIFVSLKGSEALTLVTTILLINLRYLLFAASLAPHVRCFSTKFLAIMAHGVTDETYAVSIARCADGVLNKGFIIGLFTLCYLSWSFGAWLGAVIGSLLPGLGKWGFDFALSAMFICLLVWQLRNLTTYMVAAAAVLSFILLGEFYQSSWNIVIATVVAATVGVGIDKWITKR